jgi:putative heme-binding domain-containing protein
VKAAGDGVRQQLTATGIRSNMPRKSFACHSLSLLALVICGFVATRADTPTDRPYGIDRRVPWTRSRLTGSPEPPPRYRLERTFRKLQFKNPLDITFAPGSDRLFICEQAGRIYSFPKDPQCEKADLFLDISADLHGWDPKKVKGLDALYALAFHPKFATNRHCYICYVLNGTSREPLADGSRISRFRVTDADPPRIDPASETVLLTFRAGGHNGCCLKFGPDGYLYISTGDAANPNPPDPLDTGQDISDLLSSILRIDVDRTENGREYAIPPDNPFVKLPKARPEVWAYGFRNPWRMSFDRATGDLWVGDVGWELWEMVYRVQRGGNYGWSVMEGRQPVRPDSRRGPTPILPPTLDFPHTEAASITGGFVYRGKRYQDLVGAYICGDWVTHKLWATRFDGDRITSHEILAQSSARIVAFGEDHDGELYIVDYDDNGTILQLVPNEADRTAYLNFPKKLSETGLLASTAQNEPAPGVVPFSINAEQWADFATAERYVAVPGESSIRMYDNPVPVPGTFFSSRVAFPKDGVLAKTISIEMVRGNPRSRRRLETQVLHFDGIDWQGYSYRWNDEQTEAELVPASGANCNLTVKDARAPGGVRQQTWHFASRTECKTCHNPWPGQTLAFTLPQLDRNHAYGRITDNQLRTLQHAGIIRREGKHAIDRYTNPYDTMADVNARARSYLQVNCAHCHSFGGGGTADLELRFDTPLERTKTLDVRPVQGTFDIADARILAPGDPYRSVLYYRIAKLGRGRMPHIGSELVDEPALPLIHQWIRQLPRATDERQRWLERLSAVGEAERARLIDQLLATTGGALMLADAIGEHRLPESIGKLAVARGAARPDVQVRDLFERFLPPEQRVKRLGTAFQPADILTLRGDAERGQALFFNKAVTQCSNCHRVGKDGSTLGPDLTQVGKKYQRMQILENLVDPSKEIDPKFLTYVAETADGQLYTGVLVDKNDKEVVLRDVNDKEIRLPAGKVAGMLAQKKSLMPEQLLRDLTAQQAADLLEYLTSLK